MLAFTISFFIYLFDNEIFEGKLLWFSVVCFVFGLTLFSVIKLSDKQNKLAQAHREEIEKLKSSKQMDENDKMSHN
jgi:hypothetical protein